MNEIIKLRIKFLKQFDDYIHNEIGDELITNIWLINGIPNCADDDELKEIAEDEGAWLYIVDTFAACCKMTGRI